MVAETVDLHYIASIRPGSDLFNVLSHCAAYYSLPADRVVHVLHYRLENEVSVYDEFEFWDARGVILNNKIFSRERAKP